MDSREASSSGKKQPSEKSDVSSPRQGSSEVGRATARSDTITAAIWALAGAIVAAAITAFATVVVSNAQQQAAAELSHSQFLESNRIQIYVKFVG